jgi:hypothetical protein
MQHLTHPLPCCCVPRSLLLQPGDIFHILHVIAPPKQAALAPDFSPDVMGDDIQARCEIVSALCEALFRVPDLAHMHAAQHITTRGAAGCCC